jgi:hypothetical protein
VAAAVDALLEARCRFRQHLRLRRRYRRQDRASLLLSKLAITLPAILTGWAAEDKPGELPRKTGIV